MAGTLLSGTNIVYNGNPLNGLSLTSFLDKFMEKKPKQNMWHGGSQIEPAKRLDMINHLIGPEILSLAEADVLPEDLVFHKFYLNKMNSSKKSKKKKKLPEDEAAEELFDGDGGDESDVDVDAGDESDNEEIENMLDAVEPSMDSDGDYDYDDLDRVANKEDDDLVGNVSDMEIDAVVDGEDSDEGLDDDDSVDMDGGDGDDDDIEIVDVDDDSDIVDEKPRNRKVNRKQKKAGKSPFASLEEYEHLINEEDEPEEKSSRKRKAKSKDQKPKKKSSK